MRAVLLIFILFSCKTLSAQIDFATPFKDCNAEGSITLYDYRNKKWLFSDVAYAKVETLPASTFKIINMLIALETGVIADENQVVKWVGGTDTAKYGYRPDIYHNMSVKEAFELSAGWVFIELAEKIGRERYKKYLELCNYGNLIIPEEGTDFWNFGKMAISPVNQIGFLIKVYENKLPFSERNVAILKRVMVTEQTKNYTIRSKTGWTRVDGDGNFAADSTGKDIGWWVGYVERTENVYFFATRLVKKRSFINTKFGACRKEITKHVLKQIKAIE
jgi:beta-lactamase class D